MVAIAKNPWTVDALAAAPSLFEKENITKYQKFEKDTVKYSKHQKHN